jgi:receptor protein-tyrosine kinase
MAAPMSDIERLFGSDRPVPGMRPTSRVPPVPFESDLDPPSDAIDAQQAAGSPEPEDREPQQDDAPQFPLTILEPLRIAGELLHAQSDAARAERMRLLRTEILLRHRTQRGAIAVAIVGAGAAEGRSLLAAELALSLAQLNRSTLLIDADMRHPRQHRLFGTDLHDGLAQAIARGEATALYSVEGYDSMQLMTAGQYPANPIELLSDGRFEVLMDELRSTYDYIVIDTPRCSDYADGLVVSTVIGHVLTVHRAPHTHYKAARAMLRQLASSRADIIGAVLNTF